MATEYTWYVDPDVVGGAGDGTSWANAFAGLTTALYTKGKDLVTADEIYIFECRSSGGSADIQLKLDGSWVTDATRYIHIKPTSGHEALKTEWDSSRYRISVDDDFCFIEWFYRSRVAVIEGLQMERTYTSVSYSNAFYCSAVSTSYLKLKGLRIRTENSNTTGFKISDADWTVDIIDSIIEGSANDNVYLDSGVLNIYNSIIVGGNEGVVINSGTFTAYNTAIFNHNDDVRDVGGSATIDYCCADDDLNTEFTVTHCSQPSGSDWDNEYLDSANGDFTLVSGGNCEGGGTDDPSSGLYSTDMDGDAYSSPWSVGVDAKTVVGGIVMSVVQFLRNIGVLA